MLVTPLEFELGRFLVESQSGREPYLVDLRWQEEQWNRPVPFCGCFEMMAKHKKTCKHVESCVLFEIERLHL